MLSRYSFSPVIQRAMLEHSWILSVSSPVSADEFVFNRVFHAKENGSRHIAFKVESPLCHGGQVICYL